MQRVKKRKRFDLLNYLPFLIGAIVILLVIVLLTVVFGRSEKSIKLSDFKLLPIHAESNFTVFAGGIAYIDDTENCIYYLDDCGEVMWGFSGTVDGMALYAGETKLGVCVGKKLQVINQEGILEFSKEFENSIAAVAMGEKLIAVSLSSSDDTIILNSTGEEIDRITSNSNCTNIRFGVYGAGNSVWVIAVENSGYYPKYQLSTYKYDTEKKQTVTFEVDNQMIYNAVFDENLCYIFGTEKIMVRDCDYTGSVNLDYTVNGFDVIACGKMKKDVHMLLMSDGRLKAIGGGKVMNIECEEKLNYAVVSQKNYYGFSSYFMYRFKPSSGKTVKYRLPLKVERLIQGSGYVIVESDGAMYRYNIPD